MIVKNDGIKKGALLMDAGFYWHKQQLCGNIDREAVNSADGYLLSVPGGMGPLLIAQLMINLSRATQSILRGVDGE